MPIVWSITEDDIAELWDSEFGDDVSFANLPREERTLILYEARESVLTWVRNADPRWPRVVVADMKEKRLDSVG